MVTTEPSESPAMAKNAVLRHLANSFVSSLEKVSSPSTKPAARQAYTANTCGSACQYDRCTDCMRGVNQPVIISSAVAESPGTTCVTATT